MPATGKGDKDKPKPSTQSKMTDFGPQSTEQLTANASTTANTVYESATVTRRMAAAAFRK